MGGGGGEAGRERDNTPDRLAIPNDNRLEVFPIAELRRFLKSIGRYRDLLTERKNGFSLSQEYIHMLTALFSIMG